MRNINIIVATANDGVIGKDNQLIWHLPADLKHFKNLTTGHCIVMGRKTFDSIGKPLPNRTSVIITRNKNYTVEGCIVVNSLQEAINNCDDKEIFIIGGAEIYKQAIDVASKIYLTEVHAIFEGDTFFPAIDKAKWKMISKQDFSPDEKNKYAYSFCEYEKIVV